MAHRYGYRWTRQHGTTPSPIWWRDLHGLSDEQIRVGLERDAERGDLWPPSATKFRELCQVRDAAHMMPAPPALPEPEHVREQRKQRAREEMAKWRRILGVNDTHEGENE